MLIIAYPLPLGPTIDVQVKNCFEVHTGLKPGPHKQHKHKLKRKTKQRNVVKCANKHPYTCTGCSTKSGRY